MKFREYKAGKWISQRQYKSFSPSKVNHEWTWDDAIINTLLEEATQALGELNASSLIVPDVDLFIQMHVIKEANSSSAIEGTMTAFDEAASPEEFIPPERRDDWKSVV